VRVAGTDDPVTPDRGYLRLTRTWHPGDVVELDLPMPAQRLWPHPEIKADVGRVALRRGPLVYCFEGRDQTAPLHRLRLPRSSALADEFLPDMLGGISVLRAEGAAISDQEAALYRTHPPAEAPSPLMAVPYYIWCNRGPNPMQVWIRE
jgi:DUF1680 family protein